MDHPSIVILLFIGIHLLSEVYWCVGQILVIMNLATLEVECQPQNEGLLVMWYIWNWGLEYSIFKRNASWEIFRGQAPLSTAKWRPKVWDDGDCLFFKTWDHHACFICLDYEDDLMIMCITWQSTRLYMHILPNGELYWFDFATKT